MGLKEFFQEEKEARKQRKLEKKLNKKSPLTREQKFYKIAGIIVGIMVTFGALTYSCKSLASSDFDLNDAVGLTDEMVAELQTPVDDNIYFANGKIIKQDLDNCKQILIDNNADIFGDSEELQASNTFSLNSKEVGALVNSILSESKANINLIDLEIFESNDYFYEKAVYSISLGDIIGEENISKTYISMTSKLDILSNNITILDTKIKINMIEDEMNDNILKVLANYPDFALITNNNSYINSAIDLFSTEIGTKVHFIENGIEFRV